MLVIKVAYGFTVLYHKDSQMISFHRVLVIKHAIKSTAIIYNK